MADAILRKLTVSCFLKEWIVILDLTCKLEKYNIIWISSSWVLVELSLLLDVLSQQRGNLIPWQWSFKCYFKKGHCLEIGCKCGLDTWLDGGNITNITKLRNFPKFRVKVSFGRPSGSPHSIDHGSTGCLNIAVPVQMETMKTCIRYWSSCHWHVQYNFSDTNLLCTLHDPGFSPK